MLPNYNFDGVFTFSLDSFFFFPPEVLRLKDSRDLSHLASSTSENMPESEIIVSSLQPYGNISTQILIKVTPHKWNSKEN